jgi:hypothetical protein
MSAYQGTTKRFSISLAPWRRRAQLVTQTDRFTGARLRAAHRQFGCSTHFRVRALSMLGKDVLKRLSDYVVAHIDEPIEVAALSK